MKRVMRGTVLLAVAVGFLGCKGDPTNSLRNGVVKLVATPSVVFVNQGANKSVVVEAVDAQGNRLASDFALTTVGAGITVVEDTTFNPIFTGGGTSGKAPQPTRVQYIITPPNNLVSSFTVSAAGHQIVIPVTVVPTVLAATFSNAAPNLGDTVTITAPSNMKFDPTSGITATTGGAGIITARAADSSSISFVPLPGTTGLKVTKVIPTYVAGLSLTLPTTPDITVPAGFNGTDAIATAPSLAVPAPGLSTTFFDAGTYGFGGGCTALLGDPCRIYKLTLAATTTLNFTLTWPTNADLGLYFFDATGNVIVGNGNCDAGGASAAGHPETCTQVLPAGTYYAGVVFFSYAASSAAGKPTYYQLTVAQ
jgi:hypothetical protein